MKFAFNSGLWEIKLVDKKTIADKYNSENDDECKFAFGVTIYPQQEIWINKDMCNEQKIKTLKHELTHCYIWETGLYNVPHYTEEMVCDLVACSHWWIELIIKEFKEELEKY